MCKVLRRAGGAGRRDSVGGQGERIKGEARTAKGEGREMEEWNGSTYEYWPWWNVSKNTAGAQM